MLRTVPNVLRVKYRRMTLALASHTTANSVETGLVVLPPYSVILPAELNLIHRDTRCIDVQNPMAMLATKILAKFSTYLKELSQLRLLDPGQHVDIQERRRLLEHS